MPEPRTASRTASGSAEAGSTTTGHRADAAERDADLRRSTEAAALTMQVPSTPIGTDAKPSLRPGGIVIFVSSSPGAGGGHVDAEEELLRRHRPLAARADDREVGAERDDQRRQVVRRVARADVAADRAAVAHLHVGDLGADLAEDRPRPRFGRGDQLGVGDHRAELERPVGAELDPLQLGNPGQVDEHVRAPRRGPS